MGSSELRVASCYFKKINLLVASYFLRVAVLIEQFPSCVAALQFEMKNL